MHRTRAEKKQCPERCGVRTRIRMLWMDAIWDAHNQSSKSTSEDHGKEVRITQCLLSAHVEPTELRQTSNLLVLILWKLSSLYQHTTRSHILISLSSTAAPSSSEVPRGPVVSKRNHGNRTSSIYFCFRQCLLLNPPMPVFNSRDGIKPLT